MKDSEKFAFANWYQGSDQEKWPHETAGFRDYACKIIVLDPEGYVVFVRETEKRNRSNDWKLPGGRSETGEFPPETASRELEEETGIAMMPEDLKLAWTDHREGHAVYVFVVKVSHFSHLKSEGDEGEEVGVFDFGSIADMPDFFKSDLNLMEKMDIVSSSVAA